MANIQHSPSLSAKLKARDAANKIKHGSPKLQEVLRQRCRERMREKRGQLFNKRRQGLMETDEEVHETLTEIVRQELSQLATMEESSKQLLGLDLDPMTQEQALDLQLELIAQEEEWMAQEFANILKSEEEKDGRMIDRLEEEAVFCPLCVKGCISEVLDFLVCSACNFRLPLKASVTDFGKMIKDSLRMHSVNCNVTPAFGLLPENDTVLLYLACDTCSYFYGII